MSPPSTTNPLKRKLLFAIKASRRHRSLSGSQSFIESGNRIGDKSIDSLCNTRQSFDSIRKKPRLPNGLADSTLSIKKMPMKPLCPGCELKMCFGRSKKSHHCGTDNVQEKEQNEDESYSVELNEGHGYSPKFQMPSSQYDGRPRSKKLSSTAKLLSSQKKPFI